MSSTRSHRLRGGIAIACGVTALASLAGLVLAFFAAGPESALVWSLGKAAVAMIGVAGLGGLVAGGARGIRGFVAAVVCLASGVLSFNALWGWGVWGLLLGRLFLVLAVATPGLVVAGGFDRWRQPA